MNMKIGICFGGYNPLHQGHLDLIMRAKKENDLCFVFVCGYDNEPRSLEINLNINERFDLIKDFFYDDEQIIVNYINDTELGIDQSMSDHNWIVWQNEVKDIILNYIFILNYNFKDVEFTWYVASDTGYKEILERINILNGKIIEMDRVLPISGTQIRNNPIKYFNNITRPFKPYMCHNILVVGTSSEGKSTLVQDISNYFDIPFAPEYGRLYMEYNKMTDIDLSYNEFNHFLFGQINLCNQHKNNAKNGIFISDTDSCVTLMYAKTYINDPAINISQEEYDDLYKCAKTFHKQKKVKWDKIFVLPPNKTFKDDGLRYMKQSSMEEREKNFKILEELLNDFYPNVSKTYLTGSYYENFNVVKDYINNLMK